MRAALHADRSSVIVTVIRSPIDLLGNSIVVNEAGDVMDTLAAGHGCDQCRGLSAGRGRDST